MLSFAVDLAIRAGESTLSAFRSGIAAELKADNSPVTEADRFAERLVREAIAQEYPEHGVFGEEYGPTGSESHRWVVDPIDGTKSFIAGVPLYGTLLSYEEDGVPVIGVVSLPALGLTAYAEKGGGAFTLDGPTKVSSQTEWSSVYLVTSDVRQYRKQGNWAELGTVIDQVAAVRTWGDAYASYLMVTGKADLFVDPQLHPWDVSALSLLIEEAGGRVTDREGNPNPRTSAYCSNGVLHERLLEAFRAS